MSIFSIEKKALYFSVFAKAKVKKQLPSILFVKTMKWNCVWVEYWRLSMWLVTAKVSSTLFHFLSPVLTLQLKFLRDFFFSMNAVCIFYKKLLLMMSLWDLNYLVESLQFWWVAVFHQWVCLYSRTPVTQTLK